MFISVNYIAINSKNCYRRKFNNLRIITIVFNYSIKVILQN